MALSSVLPAFSSPRETDLVRGIITRAYIWNHNTLRYEVSFRPIYFSGQKFRNVSVSGELFGPQDEGDLETTSFEKSVPVSREDAIEFIKLRTRNGKTWAIDRITLDLLPHYHAFIEMHEDPRVFGHGDGREYFTVDTFPKLV